MTEPTCFPGTATPAQGTVHASFSSPWFRSELPVNLRSAATRFTGPATWEMMTTKQDCTACYAYQVHFSPTNTIPPNRSIDPGRTGCA